MAEETEVSNTPAVMVVFGTRPEAIKMCPLVLALRETPSLRCIVCVTGQHRQMLDQVLHAYGVVPDYDLSIMKEGQTPASITTDVLAKMTELLRDTSPDVVLVHGDTTTAFATALAAFYLGVPVGHVEAGLRTYNMASPFPEEFNREAIDAVSSLHFAPTDVSRDNLLAEQRDPDRIWVTGNTGIDALQTTVRPDYTHPYLDWAAGSKLLLVTAHRRENLGDPMRSMFRGIRRVVESRDDVKAIYPVHLNPAVRNVAREELGDCDKIRLVEPLDVLDFHNFMARSYLILT
ncbi:MAG: UDP-N-acetylglucosamine 2-epimerase (non-hydrolyzing), partial [Coriobacteriaceae bacterium]|nr:UDP-N-acetylglucosamine 2-epimerase (non-hydrolyzing) [Coriobacteriaceae bacterium]